MGKNTKVFVILLRFVQNGVLNQLNIKKMKKIAKLFILAVMMLCCGQTMAQTRGVFFVGTSFRMKDFAEFDGCDEFALLTYDENESGAVFHGGYGHLHGQQ